MLAGGMANVDNSDQKIQVIPTNGIRPKSYYYTRIITFVDECKNRNCSEHSSNRSSNSAVCIRSLSSNRTGLPLRRVPWWFWLPSFLLPPRLRILSPLVASLLVASLVALSLVVLEQHYKSKKRYVKNNYKCRVFSRYTMGRRSTK